MHAVNVVVIIATLRATGSTEGDITGAGNANTVKERLKLNKEE
jgi:hypothetical protein